MPHINHLVFAAPAMLVIVPAVIEYMISPAAVSNGGFTVYSKTDGHVIQPTQSLVDFWVAALKNSGTDSKPGEGDP